MSIGAIGSYTPPMTLPTPNLTLVASQASNSTSPANANGQANNPTKSASVNAAQPDDGDSDAPAQQAVPASQGTGIGNTANAASPTRINILA